jgi:hypothetical protein
MRFGLSEIGVGQRSPRACSWVSDMESYGKCTDCGAVKVLQIDLRYVGCWSAFIEVCVLRLFVALLRRSQDLVAVEQ